MKKATIIFGSTTGNTEIVADKIAENLAGYETQVVYVTDAKDDALVQGADLVIYGCSTMGLGELQEDFLPYYENRMTAALLKGKDVAVFGLGDKENYEDYFCWSARCSEWGLSLLCPSIVPLRLRWRRPNQSKSGKAKRTAGSPGKPLKAKRRCDPPTPS